DIFVSPPQACPRIRWLSPGPLRVVPGHFGVPRGGRDRLRPPPGLPRPQRRLLLRDVSVTWALCGGRDLGPAPPRPRPRGAGPAPPRAQEQLMELYLGKVSTNK
ncbi:autophagy-related protein 2 homolog A-like, partial [Passer montanus]|uniref:autophagy-related protein 2 homolog A-like n=1 Tax=Passer montanus TaxID=9160 RepID=UPI00196223C7